MGPRDLVRARTTGVRTALSALVAFAAVVPIVELAGEPGRLLVFAVVIALQLARRLGSRSLRRQLAELAALPLIGLVTGLYGELLVHHEIAGDALVVASVYAAFASRGAPPVIARATRLLMLPVVVLFVAPVPPRARGGEGILWYLAVSVIAGACVVLVDRALAAHAGDRALRGGLRELARRTGDGQALGARARRIRRTAAAVDDELAARGEAAGPLRVALYEAELAAIRGDASGAPRLLADAADARELPGTAGADPEPDAPPAPSGRRIGVMTRIAAHAAIAVALAFAISQTLFPDHWAWTVVSVLAISGGLRSRGDVLLRSGERLAGALLGTLGATVLAAGLDGHRLASIAAILLLLAVGSVLREASYAAWAFCVTSMLALVYGLYGEHGAHLLGERLLQNVIGALCVIVPSYVLLPIRTEAVVRRRLGAALAALRDVLVGLGEGAPAPQLVALVRAAGGRVDELERAVRPAVVHARLLRLARRPGPPHAVLLAEGARASEDAARALVYSAVVEGTPPPREALGDLRRALGAQRDALVRPSAGPPA